MTERYERVTREMLRAYGIRVTRWRTSMSGVASLVVHANGRVEKLLESPKPKGPMSAAIFLHEVGHHAIGVGSVRPRCLEEYRAWQFAVDTMEREGITVTDAVKRRMRRSLEYAVAKAHRRGIKNVPAELEAYLATPQPPPAERPAARSRSRRSSRSR